MFLSMHQGLSMQSGVAVAISIFTKKYPPKKKLQQEVEKGGSRKVTVRDCANKFKRKFELVVEVLMIL